MKRKRLLSELNDYDDCRAWLESVARGGFNYSKLYELGQEYLPATKLPSKIGARDARGLALVQAVLAHAETLDEESKQTWCTRIRQLKSDKEKSLQTRADDRTRHCRDRLDELYPVLQRLMIVGNAQLNIWSRTNQHWIAAQWMDGANLDAKKLIARAKMTDPCVYYVDAIRRHLNFHCSVDSFIFNMTPNRPITQPLGWTHSLWTHFDGADLIDACWAAHEGKRRLQWIERLVTLLIPDLAKLTTSYLFHAA